MDGIFATSIQQHQEVRILKEESTDTVVFSEEELLIGSWVFEGRSTESKPPKEAREIRRKKTLNFIIDSQITYMYAL